MAWLTSPMDEINYDFIVGLYGLGSVLCLIFAYFHFFTEYVQGYFIIFSLFLPALVWSLVIRHQWILQKESKTNVKKMK